MIPERGPNNKLQTCRLATAGLLAVLGMLYPRSYMAFLGLMFLDIFSHWSVQSAVEAFGTQHHAPLLRDHSPAGCLCRCVGVRSGRLRRRAALVCRFQMYSTFVSGSSTHKVSNRCSAPNECRLSASPMIATLSLLSHRSLKHPSSLLASAGREVAELAGAHVLQESHVHGRVLHLLRGPVPVGELPGHA